MSHLTAPARLLVFLSWLPVTSLTVVAAHLTNLRPTTIAFVQCNNSGLGHCAVHHSTLYESFYATFPHKAGPER
jgi:hypothetical protein